MTLEHAIATRRQFLLGLTATVALARVATPSPADATPTPAAAPPRAAAADGPGYSGLLGVL